MKAHRLTIVLHNNYLKGYSFFFPFFLLILILYSLLGKQCWYTCSRKGGKCDRFCGKDAVCCRKDWRMESGCENAQSPCVGKHCCTKKKGIVKTRIRKFILYLSCQAYYYMALLLTAYSVVHNSFHSILGIRRCLDILRNGNKVRILKFLALT